MNRATQDSSSLPDSPQPQGQPKAEQAQKLPAHKERPVTLTGTPLRIWDDQKIIWTSPKYLRPKDAEWLIPFGTATGLLIATDQHTMTEAIHINEPDQAKATTISNGTLVGLGAIPAGMYFWSLINYAPQAHETSILAGEALADSLIVNEALKAVFRRERPLVNNAAGEFFKANFQDSSFPSNHAIAAWSMATVVASEYPGWLTRSLAYGLASSVSVSRVISQKHFPSDVLVGSVAGWLIGHYVYEAHHNSELNPYEDQPLPKTLPPPPPAPNPANPLTGVSQQANAAAAAPLIQDVTNLTPPPQPAAPTGNSSPIGYFETDPDAIGSTNVPMDSWIYPALERLGSLGLIPTQSVSIRPWTRQECLRQLRQAEDYTDSRIGLSDSLVAEAERLIGDLHRELDEPLSSRSLSVESIYARYGTIAGPALADSFHFGQTWWNDFGRPLGRGGTFVGGFAVRAHDRRLFFYAREELQHSPGNPAETPELNALINRLDRIGSDDPYITPVPGRSAHTYQRPLELYGGIEFAGNAISFGKQQIYWGPTTMGPLAFSSNAEPTYNARFVTTRPHAVPLLGSLVTYRVDLVLGKLSGHSYPMRPWFNGQKFDFNLGQNLELSFTRWSIFWGDGHPITFESFHRNLFSATSTGSYVGNGAAPYGDPKDPGDRKANFDFRYKVPFLRRLVTLYADAYTDDEPSPLAAPRRAVWNPGIYITRLPWLPHMDLRVEAVSSQGLAHDYGGQQFFINNQYLDGNTNKGFMLGNAIGRDSRAIEGRTTYWFSSQTKIEAGYRQNKGGTLFLPRGSTITDGFLRSSVAFNHHWSAEAFAQYERWVIPSYKSGSQHNLSGWLQITWTPDLSLRR